MALHRFTKGNNYSKNKTGKKFKTIKGIINDVAKTHGGKIENLYELMIDRVYEGLRDLPLKESSKLASELLKYVIPVKKESLNISFTFEDYLKQKQLKLQDQIMQDQSKRIETIQEITEVIPEQTNGPQEVLNGPEEENALASLSVSASSGNPNQCTAMIILPDASTK